MQKMSRCSTVELELAYYMKRSLTIAPTTNTQPTHSSLTDLLHTPELYLKLKGKKVQGVYKSVYIGIRIPRVSRKKSGLLSIPKAVEVFGGLMMDEVLSLTKDG